MTLANKLTLTRLLIGLVTFGCLWTQRPPLYAAALVLFLLAAATDWVDGYIARKTRSVSAFGKTADPIADKVLVIGALIAFVRIPGLGVPVWAVFLIIVRELLVGGLRALAGGFSGRVLAAERGGKWKMAVQSVSVIYILLHLTVSSYAPAFVPDRLESVPHHLVVLSMIVSLLSGAEYLYNNRGMLRKSWDAPKDGRR